MRFDDRELHQSQQGFFTDAAGVMATLNGEDVDVENAVDLPGGFNLGLSTGEAMLRRRSVQRYSGEPIDLSAVATIVRAGGGISAKGQVQHLRGGTTWSHMRFTPSGGGLHATELYVAALNVRGLDRGMYRYDPLTDRLLEVASVDMVSAFMNSFATGDNIVTIDYDKASAVLVFIGRPWRLMRKYGARGVRHLFIEAGQISQNAHLAATALGVGSIDCSSVYDDEAHLALEIDGIYTMLVHTMVLGDPA
ncbi:SagB/ThcOx family dehydrogenase [Nocardia sp. NPDC051570]|uniref:SagB/ThcOx family dehydrogenase n=1 Tax=Nocardia sp. NPDC051570 TaxID=3364324 RepID=UPI00379DAFB9